MLYESVASSNTDQYYQELIMKCIWKTIKYIPEWDADLDYNKVLCEIYRFMNVSCALSFFSKVVLAKLLVICELKPVGFSEYVVEAAT